MPSLIGRCGGGVAGSSQFAMVWNTGNITVPTTTQTYLDFAHFETTDESAFYTAATVGGAPNNQAGDICLGMNKAGVYVGMIIMQWFSSFNAPGYLNFEPGVADHSTIQGINTWRTATNPAYPALAPVTFGGGFVIYVSDDNVAAGGALVAPYVLQDSGSDQTARPVFMAVQYTPAPGSATQVY